MKQLYDLCEMNAGLLTAGQGVPANTASVAACDPQREITEQAWWQSGTLVQKEEAAVLLLGMGRGSDCPVLPRTASCSFALPSQTVL